MLLKFPCAHASPRGDRAPLVPTWWWCGARGRELMKPEDCAGCRFAKPTETRATPAPEGEQAMPAPEPQTKQATETQPAARRDWDAPASRYIAGAPASITLAEHARTIGAAAAAKLLGCSIQSARTRLTTRFGSSADPGAKRHGRPHQTTAPKPQPDDDPRRLIEPPAPTHRPAATSPNMKAGAAMKKDPPANTTAEEKEDQLRKLGFIHVPPHALRHTMRRGKYIAIQGHKGVPKRLMLSAELSREAGIEPGTYVDIFQDNSKLAIVVGSGEVTVSNVGASYGISCSRPLEELGLKVGDRLTAAVKDGVVFTVARSAAPTNSGAPNGGGGAR